MTPVRPCPAFRYYFLPSLLRLVFHDARSAQPGARAGAAGLSLPGPLLGHAPRGTAPLRMLRPLSSTSPLSRGCCGAKTPVISPSKRARPAEEGGIRLRFARLSEHATAPTRGSARAAGYDLYSAYEYTIPPMEKALVKTDIQIALPSGCYGRVAGVIDEDYRGNVGVVLFNFGKEIFEVKKGDRIAQLICERIFYPEIEEVRILDDTERGSGGFGSTGKN
ncbi:deoxyuridine 5'-triphosphate nucleotidohydrolase, mitochondrial isoform X2 [Cynocephalus volans]|uniref:deoxyuridine 5'-triphosphate nucleotidohydrolase, mitochondrial isoform X2 n=1 Tax=Cynocephalus volans TaxID=110931 RepID=UPI002FC920E3